jgi:hypothetical protein
MEEKDFTAEGRMRAAEDAENACGKEGEKDYAETAEESSRMPAVCKDGCVGQNVEGRKNGGAACDALLRHSVQLRGNYSLRRKVTVTFS